MVFLPWDPEDQAYQKVHHHLFLLLILFHQVDLCLQVIHQVHFYQDTPFLLFPLLGKLDILPLYLLWTQRGQVYQVDQRGHPHLLDLFHLVLQEAQGCPPRHPLEHLFHQCILSLLFDLVSH